MPLGASGGVDRRCLFDAFSRCGNKLLAKADDFGEIVTRFLIGQIRSEPVIDGWRLKQIDLVDRRSLILSESLVYVAGAGVVGGYYAVLPGLSLIHISEPTRPY